MIGSQIEAFRRDDAGAAYGFGERLREAVAATGFVLDGQPHRLTISIGVAQVGPNREDRSTLMQAADAALYRAKEEGRDCVRVA